MPTRSPKTSRLAKGAQQGIVPIIGWREWVTLEGLGVQPLRAKIDTGARTSALHAFRVTPFQREGAQWVEFFVHPVQERRKPEIRCEAAVLEQRRIKSSNGQVELRYVIETRIALFGKAFDVEVTLTNRDEMGFRMLVGREAMRGRFLVDPGGSYLAGEPASETVAPASQGHDE